MTSRKPATLTDEELLHDAGNVPAPSSDLLHKLSDASEQLRDVQQQIAAATVALEDLQKQERRLINEVLPSLMDEGQVKDVTLEFGDRLIRGEEIYASIAKDKATAAAAWLIKNGYGAIVKSRIVIEYEKGDIKLATLAKKVLKKAKVGFSETSAVHPQTLKAFVRESVEKGRKLPESISVHVQPVVQIKLPRSK